MDQIDPLRQCLSEVSQKARDAKHASRLLALAPATMKNAALGAMAGALRADTDRIISANSQDVSAARLSGIEDSMIDRLMLTEARIEGMATALEELINLPDPVGETIDSSCVDSGLIVERRRVPLGVVGIIYESRPNVTVDIAGICLKAGNAVVLRGGTEARHSNRMLRDIVHRASVEQGLPSEWLGLVEGTDRALVGEMLCLNEYFDVIVPRGGAGLVSFVVENARVPVLETGFGVCHTYIHESADLKKAGDIVFNAKVRRPSICNALDSLIVDKSIASEFLPAIANRLVSSGVVIKATREAAALIGDIELMELAIDEDFDREFLSLEMVVSLVDGLDQALFHIASHGSGHSEAIVTEDRLIGNRFLNEVDAGAVFLNASTQFTDGGEFGLGAEIGISTQKLHARGPMGLREMTTYKWIIVGDGHIRV
jgi:glutamate-5-semialdehyde dehydrogenase